MKLSVVILNYNVSHFLQLCLQSVKDAIRDLDAEIIVVDNASSDDSCEMVRKNFDQVKLISNASNTGFSKGNNIGVAQATGEYICILNPDTVVAEDTFIKILEFAEHQDKLGAVTCKLIDGSGCFLPESKRNLPTVSVALKKMLGNSKQYYANHLNSEASGEIDVLVGAFMVMKRDLFHAVSGFDEDYFMYGEDIDLSYKILKAGFQNYYFGGTTVIHFKGESTLKDHKYAKRFYGAMRTFYQKHFRQNLIFDVCVWFGIWIAQIFKPISKPKIRRAMNYVFYSDQSMDHYGLKFPFEIEYIEVLDAVSANTEIIFDANSLTYGHIITSIERFGKNNGFTYKILPKNSNFILGSNDSKHRGEVIQMPY